jgi:hypothetical protein
MPYRGRNDWSVGTFSEAYVSQGLSDPLSVGVEGGWRSVGTPDWCKLNKGKISVGLVQKCTPA